MKQNLLYKWAFATILAIASFANAFAYSQITSLSELKAGDKIKIYPYGRGGVSSLALACKGDGNPLTSYSDAGDGDEWTLEDAGNGAYYLKNELGCYWAYQNYSEHSSLICTTDKSSAVKVNIHWDNVYNGVGFWYGGSGLTNIEGNFQYNWCSNTVTYHDDSNTTFVVYKEVKVDGIIYDLNLTDKTAQAYKVDKNEISNNIEIPEYVDFNNERFLVTSLRNSCFYGCTSLESITLPNSITSLGGYCFERCTSLESITLPNSITSMGNFCFWGCISLVSITIPNSVTSLGVECFYYCSSLTSITLPDSIKSLGKSCFEKCGSLTNITLPNGITSLGEKCFQDCTNLTSVTLLSGNASIGDNCFQNCSNLTNITLLDGITSLGDNCFYGCSSLTNITLPNSITSLGSSGAVQIFGVCRRQD